MENNGIAFMNNLYKTTHPGYFGMVVSHLLDRGWGTLCELTDDDIAEIKADWQAKEREAKENGMFLLITADYVEWLNKTARDIAKNVTPVTFLEWCEVNKPYNVKGIKKA